MTLSDFEVTLRNHPIVLAKFSAKWCGPCKAMEPGLRQLEAQADFPLVIRVDVEEEIELSAKYGVRAMPTLMLFANGEPIKTQVGALSPSQLKQFVQQSTCIEQFNW